MKKILSILITAIAVLTACTDPNDGETFVQPTEILSEMTATSILEQNMEENSLWLQLLHHADYYNALKNPDTRATVFCPTNEAMQKFLKANGYNTVGDIPVDYAKAIVQIHIISGTLIGETELNQLASKDSLNATEMTDSTLFGSYLTLRYGYTITDVDDAQRTSTIHVPDSIYINNHARLDKFTATTCSNASLFSMGDVIRPLTETILDKLEQEAGYSIFAQAVKQGGYDSVSTSLARRYTCFAVPDEVYQREGITDVNSLQSYLNNHSNSTEDAKLENYIKYHFMTREYYTNEIFNFQTDDQTLIYDTQFSGQAFTATLQEGVRKINGSINILRSDIPVRNGLIHKIDAVMPVFHPTPVTVKWDFLNQADIISFVNKYGADKKLGNIFTNAPEKNDRQIDLSGERFDGGKNGEYGEITSFTCQPTETKTKSSSFRRVAFTKDSYTSAKDLTPKHGSYMDNYLTLNLGFAGWIEFTTPAIIAGNYKVVIHYIKDLTQKDLFNGGTMTQFDLDDMQSIVYLYKGLTLMPLYESVQATVWNKVTFENSGMHTFKITMRDINAKNSSSYNQRLDYVEFIPID